MSAFDVTGVQARAGARWSGRVPVPGWRFNIACVAALGLALVGLGVVQDLGLLDALMPASLAGVLGEMLDVESERSAFTWLSVVALFVVANLLHATGRDALAGDRDGAPVWLGLAAVFLLLSFDEFFGLHERLNQTTRAVVGGTGLFYFAWVIPAGIASLIGFVLLLPFVASLGRRTATLMIGSAVLFLCGALGLEMLSGSLAERHGYRALGYRLLTNAEDGFELFGVLLFIYALLDRREGAGR